MLYDLYQVVVALACESILLLFCEYALLCFAWAFLAQYWVKKGSLWAYVLLWVVNTFAIGISAIPALYLLFGSGSFGDMFACLIGYCAFPIFLTLTGVTISTAFQNSKMKRTVPYIAGVVLLMGALAFMAIKTAANLEDFPFMVVWPLLMLIATAYLCLYVPFARKKNKKDIGSPAPTEETPEN